MAEYIEYNINKGETKIMRYGITQRDKPVEIIQSVLDQSEQMQNFNVIKISEGLYITSHCLIKDSSINKKLNFEELKYDFDKDCYVDIDKYNNNKTTDYTNLTKENVEKMWLYLDRFIDTKIKKIDITNTADVMNQVAFLSYLKEFEKGIFNKNSYQEIEKAMVQEDIKFTKLETQLNKNINKFLIKNPEEEL